MSQVKANTKKSKAIDILGALRAKMMDKVENYIKSEQDLEKRDRDGRTLLIDASADGETRIVKLLIKAGANLNAADKSGKMSLHFAASNKHSEILDVLIDAGAKVDAKDGDGNTPLSDAVFAAEDDGRIIEKLLKAGADRNLRNEHGVSPVELAESISNYDLMKYFRVNKKGP